MRADRLQIRVGNELVEDARVLSIGYVEKPPLDELRGRWLVALLYFCPQCVKYHAQFLAVLLRLFPLWHPRKVHGYHVGEA
eukprot:1451787-Rhodomonas_salina.1